MGTFWNLDHLGFFKVKWYFLFKEQRHQLCGILQFMLTYMYIHGIMHCRLGYLELDSSGIVGSCWLY